MKRSTGRYITTSTVGEAVKAFVPNPLPPDPPLETSERLQDAINRAHLALGGLNTVTSLLRDVDIFLYMYVRKEAVYSSQIEGTQSTLIDLLRYEGKNTPGVPLDDVTQVSQYVAAMNIGLKRLQEIPLSLRLIRELHAILMHHGRGSDKTPGEFRTSQNWIGGSRPGNARFVPPPPDLLMDCLGAWEKFLHNDPVRTPTLIKVALAHAQFETIHPFLDGNGRLGRLLIPFLLCAEDILKEPLLYISLYFRVHRTEYYDRLQAVRLDGDWEGWVLFFLDAVASIAETTVETTKRLIMLFERDEKQIQSIGRSSPTVLGIHRALCRQPIMTRSQIGSATHFSAPTVAGGLTRLQELGIVTAPTDRKRGGYYSYNGYLKILNEGTEVKE